MTQQFGNFAVKTPFSDGVLTYELSPEVTYELGRIYQLPFRKKTANGLFLGLAPAPVDPKFKIHQAGELATEMMATPNQIDLWRWMAGYYHYPLGQLVWDAIPKILKRPRTLEVLEGLGKELAFEFNDDQKQVIREIEDQVAKGQLRHLIHGVTGSGKTGIYLKFIKETLARGRSALFLLPEINLTPQFLETFREHVSAPIFTYHSEVSASDKFNLWSHLNKTQTPSLVIGVRSSIFLPLKNLGIIVVDEEHDQSFKQDDRCPYNARDIAIKRAQLENIPVILGSATPMLESYYSHQNSGTYHQLPQRAGSGSLPEVTLIDERAGVEPSRYPITDEAIGKIKERIAMGEQVLVFVNRLGFSNYLQCRSCGHRFECPNCSSNLRYFKNRAEVLCHICGYKGHAPESCPECQNMQLLPKGYGTERIEEILRSEMPSARIDRFDRDEIKTFTKLKETLDRFHNHETDILVGTQMLSKGHNFKKVNLVVILGTDSQLNFPDFRANERVYQLLTQITGRSGRFGPNSEVVIQSLNPESDIYELVKVHSFDGFYQSEIHYREICSSPPFNRLAAIYLSSKSQSEISTAADVIAEFAHGLVSEHFKEVQVLGPRPALVEKRVNRFNWTLLLKSPNINQIHNTCLSLERFVAQKLPKIDYKVDIDPYVVT